MKKKRRKKEKSQSTAVVNAAKWQAAEAWREAKQSCVGSTAVVDAVKWQGAIKQRRGSQECAVAARPRPCQWSSVGDILFRILAQPPP